MAGVRAHRSKVRSLRPNAGDPMENSLLNPSRPNYRPPPRAPATLSGRTARPAGEPARVLVVATLFRLPYRVLRCAAAAGLTIFVLGTRKARGLASSRCCRTYFAAASPIDGAASGELAVEINRLVGRLALDLVIPADADATRSIIAIRGQLSAPCFPLPDLEAFDLLNDKWRFSELCRELGVPTPQTRLFESLDELAQAITGGAVTFPMMAKPLSLSGGRGCVRLTSPKSWRRLRRVDYAPILAQSYVDGADISANLYCEDGEIEGFLTQHYAMGAYRAYHDDEVFRHVSAIARKLKLSGIFGFDIRLTPQNELVFLECNPRVYHKIAMSMLAGINFIALGLPWRPRSGRQLLAAPVTIKFPKAVAAALARGRGIPAEAWPALKHLAADPVPFLRETLGLEQGR